MTIVSGIDVRVSQLLNQYSGRAVISAFDHGAGGAIRGGEDPFKTLSILCDAGSDGILLTAGLAAKAAKYLSSPGSPRLVIGLDSAYFGNAPMSGEPMTEHRLVASPKEALRLGATAGKMFLPLGLPGDSSYADSLQLLAQVAEECRGIGLPLMVEPICWGDRLTISDELIANTSRIALEYGASILKISAPEDDELLREIVVRAGDVPVLILGGSQVSGEVLSESIDRWMTCGAAGVVVGRNVWNRPDPGRAVNGLKAAVHERDQEKAREYLADQPLG